MESSPPPINITISPDGDFKLHLFAIPNNDTIPEEETFLSLCGEPKPGRRLSIMTVSREVLIDKSAGFRKQLKGWEGHALREIEAETDTVASFELVLRALHDTLGENEELYSVEVKEVWEAIYICNTYEIDVQDNSLVAWFKKWLEGKNIKEMSTKNMRSLLFPCYVFNNARAFATLTKAIVYNDTEPIIEVNPTRHRIPDLGLPRNIISSLVSARGSTRGKMLRGLLGPKDTFLNKLTCKCRSKSLFSYNGALKLTEIYPLEEQHHKSLSDVLSGHGFVNFSCAIPPGSCSSCRFALDADKIKKLRSNIMNYFDGLCLDCMNMTKLEDADEDYWEHDALENWDEDCRINHSQPTWYFSFMGRKPNMQEHQAEKKERARYGY